MALGSRANSYAGPDGLARVAKVKTTSTVATYSKKKRKRELSTSSAFFVRPVTKLCLLELDCDKEDETRHAPKWTVELDHIIYGSFLMMSVKSNVLTLDLGEGVATVQ